MSKVRWFARLPTVISNVGNPELAAGASSDVISQTAENVSNVVAVQNDAADQHWNIIPTLAIFDSSGPSFFIQHVESQNWACVSNNTEGDNVLIISNSTATIWCMGYDKDNDGHYIYPKVNPELLWGLEDDTKVTLRMRTDTVDKKNLWTFT